jgi:hypothetical protein
MKMKTASEISTWYHRVSVNALKEWQAISEQANEGSIPDRIRKDHKQDENPYLSQYGREMWMTEVRQCSALLGYRCVLEMIDHIDNETKIVMKVTPYEGKGLWYHDALSLMTCNKSIHYMKEKGIFKNWLLPLGRLQEGTRYHESIQGDSPELLLLDETLNMDSHVSARYHVTITSHLPNNDPLKFSFSTHKEISRAYLRHVDPVIGSAPLQKELSRNVRNWKEVEERSEKQGVIWYNDLDEMDTESAVKATDEEAAKPKSIKAQQNGYTVESTVIWLCHLAAKVIFSNLDYLNIMPT